ncbi:hypothetical protein F7725_017489 [Dissostichus mawsoni]|uniref:Uncharacterized protein n=1 Tax=Dissostichus mawsoni TaxID=36200 RepID=A0A7J5Z569_DISMA|nr:hypothetical protein F7725_017489 [Dissostichus mawsoni]
MAAPLTLLLIVAVTIRAALYRSSLADLISERVEVVSPLTAWKRVVEGLALLDLGVSPYSGDVFHETPLIIYLFHFLVDYAEITFMFRKQKYALEADRYPLDCLELIRSPKEMFYIPLKVAMFYLLNPFTILSCVAKSTCGLNNAVLSLFILSTVKASVHPGELQACQLLVVHRSVRLHVLGSLFVIVCLSFFLLGSGTSCRPSTASFPDLTPNIGLFWYFFAEMFEHFRSSSSASSRSMCSSTPSLCPSNSIAVISIFKSYPTVGDIALYMAFLPEHLPGVLRAAHLLRSVPGSLAPLDLRRQRQLQLLLLPITLLFNVAQILLVSDYFYAFLRREHHLCYGLYLKRKDGSEATLVLK